jgi:hypothetical protein
MSWWKADASEEGQQRLRTVAYYRHSAEIGQENSVEIQQDNVRAFADKHDLEIVEEFADRGKSGLNAEGRPAFTEMMRRVQTQDDLATDRGPTGKHTALRVSHPSGHPDAQRLTWRSIRLRPWPTAGTFDNVEHHDSRRRQQRRARPLPPIGSFDMHECRNRLLQPLRHLSTRRHETSKPPASLRRVESLPHTRPAAQGCRSPALTAWGHCMFGEARNMFASC